MGDFNKLIIKNASEVNEFLALAGTSEQGSMTMLPNEQIPQICVKL